MIALWLFLLAIYALYLYFKHAFGYFARRNVPYAEPSIPFGNMTPLWKAKQPFTLQICDDYFRMKSEGHKHYGWFTMLTPVYVPIDVDIIKNIMSKDFMHFRNRGTFYNERDDPLSAHLFAIEDERWKNLRVKLSPTFTTGKMKMMFQTMIDCAGPMNAHIDKIFASAKPLDVKETVARFTTDIIGSCAFGLECNSFADEDPEFRHFGRRVFNRTFWESMNDLVCFNMPNLAKRLRLTVTSKDVHEFFMRVVSETVKYRETSNVSRKDFIQMLVELKKENVLDINEIAAQSFVFFLAGFETSSTLMNYAFFELAKDKVCQEKLREEILTVLKKYDGEICYDSIMEMKYLQQVIDETLRLYPPVPIINRQCNEDYKLPNMDFTIEKGQTIMIPAYSLHHDEEYYPDPERFDPERFAPENKDRLVPYTFLPFGEGPRICIGLRFGYLQAKVGMVYLLKKYRIGLAEGVPHKLSFDPKGFILTNVENVMLTLEKI